ncbi:hypothetical protein A2763_01955 [Candidatus Kaiserbacteria bacterium RIFCSPHIGHO2_01_FULL_54_36]|uniref:Uncharacterized protein n=1 Tax=Candidatus Kaiserbacteria bacterium RIFCSPHIGHO2_01_FULL_54_36 TaxID=1798482 RepID=A0A1F6CK10_9BACT|nr:MAG: hypothetical protein A2763_01955 [Candidatus Kaiserbacteria bacterium RIFCSPHIGHO2_01_FULL_54_36]OGG75306.1 MAG: hypothetical protein A3A41_01310 [Candidatus Kaiserbacteria bacterium RIFCSPLOWO2_01_FULL_54_22]
MSYSYLAQSPGYTAHVVAQANKALARIDTDFAALFVENPITEKGCAARAYFLTLDLNEQAALRETLTSLDSKQGCF